MAIFIILCTLLFSCVWLGVLIYLLPLLLPVNGVVYWSEDYDPGKLMIFFKINFLESYKLIFASHNHLILVQTLKIMDTNYFNLLIRGRDDHWAYVPTFFDRLFHSVRSRERMIVSLERRPALSKAENIIFYKTSTVLHRLINCKI